MSILTQALGLPDKNIGKDVFGLDANAQNNLAIALGLGFGGAGLAGAGPLSGLQGL